MADFDSFNYDIEERLPEWWKGFGGLEPINKYTQELIAQILESLLTTMGVVQPLNCWLTIPEEYNWYHHYKPTDNLLQDENKENILINNATTKLFKNSKMHAQLPNTKRKCHAKIQLKLLGTDVIRTQDGDIDRTNGTNVIQKEIIESLTIQNADQIITLKNISTTSTIEIITETNEILIDGVANDDLVEGRIDKIKPVIKNANFQESYIDGDEVKYRNIDIKDENKKTELIITSSKTVNFDLQVRLYKPTYTTEQNIRVTSVSAFPIERIELWGYFCHPFNNQSGYRFLWSKEYSEESRTVFDRITKQFDCERFCIKVKFHGIGTELIKGFPQEIGATNKAFQPNPNLDKWGKIYGLPRRTYKENITEDEEPFTFPKYYKYPIEQDYWYEERMVNEYKFNEDAVNSLFVKDDEFNNVGMLECIYPFMDDIWVYTETVDPSSDKIQKVRNEITDSIPLCRVIEDDTSLGKSWENPQDLLDKPIYMELNPKSNEVQKLNDFSYKTKKLKCSFNLNPFDEYIPKDITIKGIELKFKTETSIKSNTIKLRDDCYFILPYPKPVMRTKSDFIKDYMKDHPDATQEDINNYLEEVYDESDNYIKEKINIVPDEATWVKDKEYYIIGGENNLFFEKEITREQLFKGNNGKVEFELGFINENDFIVSGIYLKDIILNVYYEVIPNEYSIDVSFDKKEINLKEDDEKIFSMQINVKNTGKVEVHNKEIFIIVPPELSIKTGYNSYLFNLDIDEVCDPINVIIEPNSFPEGIRTGWYDILVICEDKVISNEVLIRGGNL